MAKYDEVIDKQFGIMKGSRNIVFIKVGKGEDIYGEGNKYLNACAEYQPFCGCTFVVSANQSGNDYDLKEEFEQLDQYVDDYDEIFYVGFHNGALIGAQQCWKVEKIKNAVLYSCPLMTDLKKTKDGIERFQGEYMRFVHWEHEPSFEYRGFFDQIDNTACTISLLGKEHEGYYYDESDITSELYVFIIHSMYARHRFIVNDANRKAHEAFREAEEMAALPHHHGQLLYIYGDKGSGRSHLLYSIFTENKKDFLASVDDSYEINGGNELDWFVRADLACIDNVDQMRDKKDKLQALKEIILFTGIEDGFDAEDDPIVVLTSDASPEDTFDDEELVNLIRKGTVIEIR